MLSLHQIVVSLCVSCQVMAVVISRSLGMVLPPASVLSVGRELSLVGESGVQAGIISMGIFSTDTNIMLL